MFFDKPKTILVLRPMSLEFLGRLQGKIEFSDTDVKYLEILNGANLEKFFLSELKKFKKQKVIMILGNELVFSKIIDIKVDQKPEQLLEEFVATVPFEKNSLVGKYFILDKQLVLLTVNKHFYGQFKRVFDKAGWDIKATLPEVVFGKLDATLILKSYKNYSKLFFD